jgi:hypothetical protein
MTKEYEIYESNTKKLNLQLSKVESDADILVAKRNELQQNRNPSNNLKILKLGDRIQKLWDKKKVLEAKRSELFWKAFYKRRDAQYKSMTRGKRIDV